MGDEFDLTIVNALRFHADFGCTAIEISLGNGVIDYIYDAADCAFRIKQRAGPLTTST